MPRFRITHRQQRTLRLAAWLSTRHTAIFRSKSHAAILAGLGLTTPPPRRFYTPILLDVPVEADVPIDDAIADVAAVDAVDEVTDWAAAVEAVVEQVDSSTTTSQVSDEAPTETPATPAASTSIARDIDSTPVDAIADRLPAPVFAPAELVAAAAGASKGSDLPRWQSDRAEVDRTTATDRDMPRSKRESGSSRSGRRSRIEEVPPASPRQQASHDRSGDRASAAPPGDGPRTSERRTGVQPGRTQASTGSDTRRGDGSPPEPPSRGRHSNATGRLNDDANVPGDAAASRSASRMRQDESSLPRTGGETSTSGAEQATRATQPSPAAIPPPPNDPVGLFSPRTDAKRSPQRWFERLNDLAYRERAASDPVRQDRQHGDPATSGEVEPRGNEQAPPTPRSTASRPPGPLPDSVRRFLTPLVGVDPATVRIYQGETGDQVAREHQADAVTIGDDIYLSAGQSIGSPETLGLLAHEITHVAQQRNLRFVPPVIRDRSGAGGPPTATSSGSAGGGEEQALAVEGAVRALARSQGIVYRPAVQRPGVQSSGSTGAPPSLPTPRSLEGAWGGLPAPWEPLPDWMNQPASPTAGGRTASPARTIVPQTEQAHAQPVPQRAAWDRAIDEPPTGSSDTGAQGNQQAQDAVEPDLDELARQVYGVLRRKLAAERRRMG